MCAFGTNDATLTVTSGAFLTPACLSSRLPHASVSFAMSTIPFKSSSVSVGKPIMKYSFRLCHPSENAQVAAWIRSSCVTPLLITFLSLCVPASGANVRPVLRPFWTSFARSTENESTRRDGRLTEMPVSPCLSRRLLQTSRTWE